MIEALRDMQTKRHLTDQQMANLLGCHRGTWNRIKRGRYPATLDRFYVQVTKRFPELLGYLVVHTQTR